MSAASCVHRAGLADRRVLMFAFTNAEAIERTRATASCTSTAARAANLAQGSTSGNTQAVRALRVDCDGDALLALVEPAGPACHTGERTCFHNGELEPSAPFECSLRSSARSRSAPASARGLVHRRVARDPQRAGAKCWRSRRVTRAAREESDERVDEEAPTSSTICWC